MAGRDRVDAMEAFIDDVGVSALRHIADEAGAIWATYEIRSQPAWVFIDDDGTATSLLGALGEDGLAAEIDALLAT